MSLWRQLIRGLRSITQGKVSRQDIADEVESYLQQSVAEFESRGYSPADARRAAQQELGSTMAVRDQVCSYGWENGIEALLLDLRYAARRLRNNPGFTTTSVLTLALGIAASTSIFGVIESVILRPLPYSQSEQIVALRHTAPGIHIEDMNIAASLYFTYSEESRVFQDVGIWFSDTASVTGAGTPEEVPVLAVTHRFLPVLGINPAIGRPFRASDDDPKGPEIVLLTDGYWKARFGGDPKAVGRRLMVDGTMREIVGVLPPSFQFMDRPVDLIAPLRMNRSEIRLISFCCQGIARLKPGVSITQANADVARMLRIAPEKFPMNPGFGANAYNDARMAPRVRTLKDYVIGDLGKRLWVLMGAVGIVLLIACANIANLLLVRAEGRQQELAVRAALGAGWKRIAREMLAESLLLGLTGGALGLALAYGALRLLAASEIRYLPRVQEISVDPIVLAFTVDISLCASLVFGLIPVFKYARPHLSNALHGAGRSQSHSKERHRARNILVITQVALALVLLVGSGLMIRTFRALRHIDPGFSYTETETFQVSIPDAQIPDAAQVLRLEEAVLHKVEGIPGVAAVAIAGSLPMEGGSNDPIYAEDHPVPPDTIAKIRRYKFISPGYFSTTGARLVAGRELTWAELYSRTPVALISENMAREIWGDPRAAIGKRIRANLKDDWREVIGVAADLRDDGIDQPAPQIAYWPLLQKNFEANETFIIRGAAFVVRTPRAGSSALLTDLQKAVAGVNPNLPVADVKTLESVYSRSMARTSLSLVLLAIAGGMALILGVIGIYGVISYSVSQRTREIGIRLALGAPLEGVTRMVVRHGLVLSGIGAAFGLAAALALTRLMKSLLYEVSPADPLTYAMVCAGLILAAAAASYLPARKATKVDPVEALRAE